MYDDAKQNGFIKGGLVVHHKDFNKLNAINENEDKFKGIMIIKRSNDKFEL